MSKDTSYLVYSDANAAGGGAFIDFNNDSERKLAELNMEGGICC